MICSETNRVLAFSPKKIKSEFDFFHLLENPLISRAADPFFGQGLGNEKSVKFHFLCSFLSKYSLLLSKSRFICAQRRNVSAWYFESDSPDWVSSLATRLLELGTLSVFLGWKIKLCNFFTHFFLRRGQAKERYLYDEYFFCIRKCHFYHFNC